MLPSLHPYRSGLPAVLHCAHSRHKRAEGMAALSPMLLVVEQLARNLVGFPHVLPSIHAMLRSQSSPLPVLLPHETSASHQIGCA